MTSKIEAPSSTKVMAKGEDGKMFGGKFGLGADVESTNGSHFAFGNDLTQRNKVESIIPNTPKFSPTHLEVWVFL